MATISTISTTDPRLEPSCGTLATVARLDNPSPGGAASPLSTPVTYRHTEMDVSANLIALRSRMVTVEVVA